MPTIFGPRSTGHFGSDGDVTLRYGWSRIPTRCGGILPQLPLHEGRYWFDLAVSRITPQTPPDVAARLWFGKSWRDVGFGGTRRISRQRRKRPRCPADRRPHRPWRRAVARSAAPSSTMDTAPEAAAYFAEAEQIFARRKPNKWLALTLVKQGDVRVPSRRSEFGAGRVLKKAMRLTRMTGPLVRIDDGGSTWPNC